MNDGPKPEAEAAIVRTLLAPGDPADMLDLLRDFDVSGPHRSEVAAVMVLTLLGEQSPVAFQRWMERSDAIKAIIDIADEYPPTLLPAWPQGRAAAVFYIRAVAALGGHGIPNLKDLSAEIANLPSGVLEPGMIAQLQAIFAHVQAGLEGRDSVLGRTPFDLFALEPPGVDAVSHELGARITQENQALKVARVQGDEATFRELKARIQARPGPLSRPGLDPDDPAVWLLALGRAAQASILGEDDPTPVLEPAELDLVEGLTRREDVPPLYRAILHLCAGQERLKQAGRADLRQIAAAMSHFEEVPRLTGPSDHHRLLSLTWLAAAVLRHVEISADVGLLPRARAALDQAREIAGGPTSPSWALINSLISRVDDRLGRRAAYLTGVEGLGQHAWQVLLQDDPRVARTAARQAARFALVTAAACLQGNDPDAAIRALESGRGLMLFAAAQFSKVAPRLEAAGHTDLAERWRVWAASGKPERPDDGLRRDVLSVLAGTTDLLSPPGSAEIAAALRTLDADALVYLVPAVDNGRGYAVVVPAQGSPGSITLGPDLKAEGTRPFERYLAILPGSARDVSPAPRRADLGGRLEELCAWAWGAAIGPLLDEYISTLPRPVTDRAYRLYLIPVGELALLPWPAAKRPGGGHALSEVAFSMVGSARLLCHAAELAPVRPLPVALVVGDPDTGGAAVPLPAARAEAHAVHQAYYRAGRYVGVRPDGAPSRSGAGTARQVRDWLGGGGIGEGGVLHLACHGVVETGFGEAGSRLVLADGESLAADEIVPLLAESADRQLALVVLAACNTGVSAHGYDEVYSLGTAFLTGGARTVLSTQWSVPDQATSVLMFMFHHFLMHHRLPAWEALRRAQLWMLDPGRSAPPSMPAALRERLADPTVSAALSRVEAWAGFVHLGQ